MWRITIAFLCCALASARRPRARQLSEVPDVLAVTSFRNRDESRDFWRPFLEFWPPSLGDLEFIVDYDYGNSEDWLNFTSCMAASSYAPKFSVMPAENVAQDVALSGRDQQWYGKNMWKYFLDDHAASNEKIIAIIDDDSCLLDHLMPSDFWDSETSRLIVHSLPAIGDFLDWKKWTDANSLQWAGTFMTDFPVYFYTDMLPDLRAWVVKKGLKKTISEDKEEARQQFWKAYDSLAKQKGHASEFNLILNFAYTSHKWKPRYKWKQVPKVSLGLSLHQHSSGCPTKEQIGDLRKHLLFYPNGLRTHWVEQRAEFVPSKWATKALLHPNMDAHWRMGPADTPETIAAFGSQRHGYNASGGNHAVYSELLQQHDDAIASWRAQGKPLSHKEKHPEVMEEWQQCFGTRHEYSSKKGMDKKWDKEAQQLAQQAAGG